MKKLSKNEAFLKSSQLLLPNKLKQICKVVAVDLNQVKALSIHKKYKEFLIPKGNNKFRIIEAPNKELMFVLRKFNSYLQAAYYQHQTKASYGFIISVWNETNPKNILENAKQHLGNNFMLKIDLKDFFHQISTNSIEALFKNKPFSYSNTTAETLANLFTYKGRLPMGSPTSPALSNFATITLDNELAKWANKKDITYTRFADDMTFSTNSREFTTSDLTEIKDILSTNKYYLNQNKTKFYNETHKKIVTGLALNQTIDIEKEFYDELDKDITRFKYLVEASLIVKENYQDETFKKYKQEIDGKINFIGMIEGYHSPEYYNYSKKMKESQTPTNEKLFSRWTHFNYF